MANHQCRRLLPGMAATAAALSVLAGCTASHPSAPISPAPSTAPANPAAQQAQAGAVGVSPAGVTTRVDAPAASTEEEYFQACHAAKVWMDDRPDDPVRLVEPYLQTVQEPGAAGPGTWNTPWAQLTAARQSAVIVAAQAAAGGECG